MSIENKIPSRKESFIFWIKSTLLKQKRRYFNTFKQPTKKFQKQELNKNSKLISSSTTDLWTSHNPLEMDLTAGKIENLRIACSKINGIEVPANEIFSFWKNIGKATKRNGYVAGRELREGCIIPTIGGGLCQLSNALYDAALKADFKIIERHAHTQVIKNSLAEKGRDATIYWNYVDLRFKSDKKFSIEAFLTSDKLIVRFKGVKAKILNKEQKEESFKFDVIGNCISCGKTECHKNIATTQNDIKYGKTAYLLDEFWPEYNDYINEKLNKEDHIIIPLDGVKKNKPNYAWKFNKSVQLKTNTLTTIKRAIAVRKSPKQGAQLQSTLLKHDEILAKKMAKKVDYSVKHIVISQNLLPFAYKHGLLGGRTFDVLMTRLPLANLQDELNQASEKHPKSSTLSDFRVENWLTELENKSLKSAQYIITPHSKIAELFSNSIHLDWHKPNFSQIEKKEKHKTLLFPASSLARKGVFEMKEFMNSSNFNLMVLGKAKESANIWGETNIIEDSSEWWKKVDALVLPAYVEHKPRILLKALAYNIPVIASKNCGLSPQKNLFILDQISAEAIQSTLECCLNN